MPDAASPDPLLAARLGGAVIEFRKALADAPRRHGVAAPDEAASVLAAAIDGIALHRAFGLDLATGLVLAVLDGTLTATKGSSCR